MRCAANNSRRESKGKEERWQKGSALDGLQLLRGWERQGRGSSGEGVTFLKDPKRILKTLSFRFQAKAILDLLNDNDGIRSERDKAVISRYFKGVAMTFRLAPIGRSSWVCQRPENPSCSGREVLCRQQQLLRLWWRWRWQLWWQWELRWQWQLRGQLRWWRR